MEKAIRKLIVIAIKVSLLYMAWFFYHSYIMVSLKVVFLLYKNSYYLVLEASLEVGEMRFICFIDKAHSILDL